MAKIDELFRYLKEKGGSDLHLLATLPPRVRIHGKLTDIEGWEVISDEELKELLREICSEEQWLEENIDFLSTKHRFYSDASWYNCYDVFL